MTKPARTLRNNKVSCETLVHVDVRQSDVKLNALSGGLWCPLLRGDSDTHWAYTVISGKQPTLLNTVFAVYLLFSIFNTFTSTPLHLRGKFVLLLHYNYLGNLVALQIYIIVTKQTVSTVLYFLYSKIENLQTHNVSWGNTLWACSSAICAKVSDADMILIIE